MPLWLISMVLLIATFEKLLVLESQDERCASCGYLTAGLPTNRCPECGHDVGQEPTKRA
jgi:rubrerythrin